MSETPETDELILSKNGFGATDYDLVFARLNEVCLARF